MSFQGRRAPRLSLTTSFLTVNLFFSICVCDQTQMRYGNAPNIYLWLVARTGWCKILFFFSSHAPLRIVDCSASEEAGGDRIASYSLMI